MIGSVSNHVVNGVSNTINVKHRDVDMVKDIRNNTMLF